MRITTKYLELAKRSEIISFNDPDLGFERVIWISRWPRWIIIDGVDILLFLNSFNLFAESILVLLSLLQC